MVDVLEDGLDVYQQAATNALSAKVSSVEQALD
ncbi:hypothetical protein Thi970DRAFT_00083 [Thiorhodovibrio frisius]|uniref:Uncharacterized protein n=1 Tax=Thiorhodovibrio frisius TaxID=631362 RepID=H8YVK8_9GAMM|nr:hypothetical protein Thi970DRAFT_00083 [Thiorhodovibrio frisius]WPL23021.1 hypothetical protein Thiofri_03201 [Thiorhodovibrio frisius]